MKRLGVVVSVLAVALIASLFVRVAIVESEDPLVVVHWSNSHPMREGLLEDMADRFNDDDIETPAGQPIEIHVVSCDSAVQAEDLVARVTGGASDHECDVEGERADDPTIVTPQSDDWLVHINDKASREVVDLDNTRTIAEAYLGIVTYSEMAECLRSSFGESLGYADIVALATHPNGWTSLDCHVPSWGTEPLLAFTNPNTSTSGRNVLVTLYAMAAGGAAGIRDLGALTPADVERPDVKAQVQQFQTLVDAYMPGTIPLNSRIAEGEAAGHFFLMPEDNLVSLAKGNEDQRGPDGTTQELPKITGLEMIYPKEGSVLNSNPAGIVDAGWVEDDDIHAANKWIDYLREAEQQRDFMGAGFRPAQGTRLTPDERQFAEWGLDAEPPAKVIDPGELPPDVLDKIIGSWGSVKKPAVVTFVVDVSESMKDEDRLKQVQEGLGRILDEMEEAGAGSSQVGLVTFDGTVHKPWIAPQPLRDVGAQMGDAIRGMQADGQTALYDAVDVAIRLTDQAKAEDGATRAVVVLSDGKATAGLCLDRIVDMVTESEADIEKYCATAFDAGLPVDENGHEVPVDEITGDRLDTLMNVGHQDLHVYFLGFGTSDISVGRILAEATDGDFGSADEDLVDVIEALSGYF